MRLYFHLVATATPSKRSILLLINPWGGTKKGMQLYEQIIRPLFQIAGISVTVKGT